MAIRSIVLTALAGSLFMTCTGYFMQRNCSINEVLDHCPALSQSDYCPKCEADNKVAQRPDSCPPPVCKCKFNYRRAANGTCIPTKDCPPFHCLKPNEKYVSCPPKCLSDVCSPSTVTSKCSYKIGTILECNPQCQCKDGYCRSNEECVPIKNFERCPTNEEYTTCTQVVCRPQTCIAFRGPVLFCGTIDRDLCSKGCVCKESYYRNKSGRCVTFDQC